MVHSVQSKSLSQGAAEVTGGVGEEGFESGVKLVDCGV